MEARVKELGFESDCPSAWLCRVNGDAISFPIRAYDAAKESGYEAIPFDQTPDEIELDRSSTLKREYHHCTISPRTISPTITLKAIFLFRMPSHLICLR